MRAVFISSGFLTLRAGQTGTLPSAPYLVYPIKTHTFLFVCCGWLFLVWFGGGFFVGVLVVAVGSFFFLLLCCFVLRKIFYSHGEHNGQLEDLVCLRNIYIYI